MSRWSENSISTDYSSSYYNYGFCDYFDNLLELNVIEKNLGNVDNYKVLDLASGNGRMAEYFSSKNCTVDAVDLERKHIEFLDERFKNKSNVVVTHMDAFQYVKETKNKYNIVLISGLLLFFDDEPTKKMILGILSILNDNGVLIIRDFFSKTTKITIESSIFSGTSLYYRPIKFYEEKYNVLNSLVCRPSHPFIKYEKKIPYVILKLIYKFIYSNSYILTKTWIFSPYKNMLIFIKK